MSTLGVKVPSEEAVIGDRCSNYLLFPDYIARDLIQKGPYPSERKLWYLFWAES
jgi:hypothetical protein